MSFTRRIFHLLIYLFLLVIILGCQRGDLTEFPSATILEGDSDVLTNMVEHESQYKLEGGVFLLKKNFLVRGRSNFPSGTLIRAVVIEPDQPNKIYLQEAAAVNNQGNFFFNIFRPDQLKEYELIVSFLPEEQPKNTQKIIGKRGEYIPKSNDHRFTYVANHISYSGIRTRASIPVGKGESFLGTYESIKLNQEKKEDQSDE